MDETFPSSRATRSPFLLQSLILVAAGLWIYSPSFHGDWIWDDTILVSDNETLRNWSGLGKIWFSVPATDYWPITWTLLWIEWHLWGANTLGFHLCSVALHLTSAFLLWRLLDKLGLRWGWLGALIFVVHPLMVESVAWISEIKNTLSLPFYLLALLNYINADQGESRRGYAWALFFYLVAMLCKSSVVMLPFVLLLYTWWRHDRIAWLDARRVLPYFAVALTLGCLTLYFQTVHYGESGVVTNRTFIERIIGASADVFFYLGKFAFPAGLLPQYPRWSLHPPSPQRIATLPMLFVMLWALWTCRKNRGRHLILGFGFFLINLLPVVGLVHMTWMNITWIADHLVYIPMIGLIGLTVAGLELAYRKFPLFLRSCLCAVMGLLLLLMASESHAYAAKWIDLKTLCTLKITRNWN